MHRLLFWYFYLHKAYKHVLHTENLVLCLRAVSPSAFSQSRGDVSTNVNIAARVRALSNTLTHNLFQLTLTQYECVIMCVPKMPSAPLSLLNISSVVLLYLALGNGPVT